MSDNEKHTSKSAPPQAGEQAVDTLKTRNSLIILLSILIFFFALFAMGSFKARCDCGNEVASYSDYLNSDYTKARLLLP